MNIHIQNAAYILNMQVYLYTYNIYNVYRRKFHKKGPRAKAKQLS